MLFRSVTASYSDESTKAVTNYTYSPEGALALTDETVVVSYTEGFNVRFSGTGYVASQTPSPGTLTPRGTAVTLALTE